MTRPSAAHAITATTEDYLKAIHALECDGPVGTTRLAARLRLTPGTVSAMVVRLAAGGLVHHEPYRGVRLTDAGRARALAVIRRHRLVETLLHRVLDVPADQVHLEAERLEHHISDGLGARIDALLGHPTHDPHGSPIPPLA